ncbi:Crp/Fnr family transcriptional regulator [Tellurirhabdus bombi]|uniref:Crp/Fnr family transcriptional regulator n=1 Tax=Tellurirhabdus bombi TaxID=2907205 RepID=UPI001F2C1D6E|nr:Crp/Fnr family transcriptional regulator [Tellurirhabdus bombi]
MSDPLRQALISCLKEAKLPKGTYLLKEGEVSNQLYFVVSGLVMAYYQQDDSEVTSWMLDDESFVCSISSFLNRLPSFETIRLLEDTLLLSIGYEDLQHLYQEFPSLNYWGRLLVEYSLLRQEQRIRMLKIKNAPERYHFFCHHYPLISQRAPNKYIASYLGISKFTLSRLRGVKMKNQFALVTENSYLYT